RRRDATPSKAPGHADAERGPRAAFRTREEERDREARRLAVGARDQRGVPVAVRIAQLVGEVFGFGESVELLSQRRIAHEGEQGGAIVIAEGGDFQGHAPDARERAAGRQDDATQETDAIGGGVTRYGCASFDPLRAAGVAFALSCPQPLRCSMSPPCARSWSASRGERSWCSATSCWTATSGGVSSASRPRRPFRWWRSRRRRSRSAER